MDRCAYCKDKENLVWTNLGWVCNPCLHREVTGNCFSTAFPFQVVIEKTSNS